MKWLKNIAKRYLPIEVSASELVDKRDVIISNATVEEIENGFKKIAIYETKTEDEKWDDYKDIFK